MSKHIASPRLNQLAASIAIIAGGLALVPAAYAAAPVAGTNISNVATASYTDGTNTPRTVTSNEVKTTVLQVASFTLEADRTATANPNGQVSLAHTLTNTGNGGDTFEINLANVANGTNGDVYDFTNIKVYLDANKDGVPDNNTDLNGQTITVAAGTSVGLVVVGTTSATATNGDLGKLTVSATSTYGTSGAGNGDTTKTNTDTVSIVSGPVIQITKAANVGSVDVTQSSAAARTVEYTLTYKNTGNSAASNVTITDLLPANVTYVANSGKWSGLGSALGDTVEASSDNYDFNVTTAGTVTFVIPTVAANTTGTLKFKVTVNQTAPAGTIRNVANVDPDGPGTTGNTPSNPADVTVEGVKKGTINDSQADDYADGETPDTPVGTKDDKISAITTQGTAVNFGNNGGEEIWIHNTGNVTEAFNITVDKNGFTLGATTYTGLPAGSIVELFKADGVTPLTDTNGDTTVDTGPIDAGQGLKIVARVTLPNGATGPVPANTLLTINPVTNPTQADNLVLEITNITSAKVDLSNAKGDENNIDDETPKAGEGPYNAADIIDTRTTAPNVAATFPLAITNHGSNPDNFNVTSDLPNGWTVQYFTATADGAGNLTCSSNQVTNSGNIQPGTTAYLCAKVTPPTTATPADSRDVVFTVNSPATGLQDSIKDRLVVDEVRNITFTPDRQGQVAPNGTITYVHTLTNLGNVTEGANTSVLNLKNPATSHQGSLGATTSVYVDLNNNGEADDGELVTSFTGTGPGSLNALLATGAPNTNGGAGLQPNESVTILVKVEAPANATAGQEDISTIVITPTGNVGDAAPSVPVQIIDKTTVNIGQVRLTKQQAVDANCDGTADGAFTTGTLQAKPGACVTYQITAINDGNEAVTNVVINDAVPAYTAINAPVPALDPSTPKAGVSVSNGSDGFIKTSPAFGLNPNETVKVNFTVKINN
jgi:uncharacterized repeat protein (TIGR01451 family)